MSKRNVNNSLLDIKRLFFPDVIFVLLSLPPPQLLHFWSSFIHHLEYMTSELGSIWLPAHFALHRLVFGTLKQALI